MSDANLIVEFVVPHYFASLFASQYPDEHGGFGAQVIFAMRKAITTRRSGK